MAQKIVLGYDLGGTKVAVGVVDGRGKILREVREPVQIEKGKAVVIRQLIDIGKRLIREYPKVRAVGIASAGPLDFEKGHLLDPTNFVANGKGWGKVPITRLLRAGLKRPVYLDNDAAAAMLAERWIGVARGKKNSLILTLGTGVGVGAIANGELVRAGRMLHPEASHLMLRADDPTAPCGCGNFGCMEAFLSGRNFTRRMSALLAIPDLTGEKLVELAREGHPGVLAGFSEYSRLLAISINCFVRMYSPEVVVFTGSFAAAHGYFLPATEAHLETLLARLRVGIDMMPKLKLSKLNNRAGIVGAAYIAMHR